MIYERQGKKMNNGYIELFYPWHPNARSNGTILEHRLQASIKLGRPLRDEEVVHHLDENKTNNNPENLIVFKTSADHTRFHKIGMMELTDDGTYISPEINYKCDVCGKIFVRGHGYKNSEKFCSQECKQVNIKERMKETKIKTQKRIRSGEMPDRETLDKLIRTVSFLQIGKKYNVSDNAIRKWCKKYGLPYKQKDIFPKSNFLWEDRIIRMYGNGIDITFYGIQQVVEYIRTTFNTTTKEKTVKAHLGEAIKHNSTYFKYHWELVNTSND